jgi:hypothetical protein
MSDETQAYNLAAIRELLLAAFTAEELRRFCYDRPTFRPITNRFGPGHGLDDMVDEVITYCDAYLTFPELLDEIKQANPRQYEHFAARLLPASVPADAPEPDLRAAMKEIQRHLQDTGMAFKAQVRRRRALVDVMRQRLGIQETLQAEKFFFRYYREMNAEERFEFKQIRAITDGPMHRGNRAILESLDRNPTLLEEVPLLDELRTHLVFWLNKYEKVFTPTPEMCVCFAGVEDGIPFPRPVRREIAAWLDRTAPASEGGVG